MAKKYDLHCHSTASDGVLSPTELVHRAYAQGVNVLALCDHDTIAGIDEAEIAAKEVGIELITGVEISTNWKWRIVVKQKISVKCLLVGQKNLICWDPLVQISISLVVGLS